MVHLGDDHAERPAAHHDRQDVPLGHQVAAVMADVQGGEGDMARRTKKRYIICPISKAAARHLA
jgi:hypothetical protein